MDKLRACMPRVLILEHVDSEGKCMWYVHCGFSDLQLGVFVQLADYQGVIYLPQGEILH